MGKSELAINRSDLRSTSVYVAEVSGRSRGRHRRSSIRPFDVGRKRVDVSQRVPYYTMLRVLGTRTERVYLAPRRLSNNFTIVRTRIPLFIIIIIEIYYFNVNYGRVLLYLPAIVIFTIHAEISNNIDTLRQVALGFTTFNTRIRQLRYRRKL